MEKLLQPYDKEHMRMAILKHEETFKEQVYELHRLYRMQKILMKSSIGKIRPKGQQKQEIWNLRKENNSFIQLNYHHHHEAKFNPQRKLDLEQPAAAEDHQYIVDTDNGGVLEMIDESEIELTLGPTRYINNNNNNNSNSNRRKRAEAPLTSDSGPSFSSSSTGSSHVNRRTSSSSRTHQSNKHGQQVPDMASGYRSGSKNSSSNVDVAVEEQLRQDESLKLPPWLFQVLSLNMT